MADFGDEAQVAQDAHLRASLANARAPVPAGVPGECENCGEDMPRLVDGLCAPCRGGRRR